jgi:hypothetical protein
MGLRAALDAARTALKAAETEVRTALATVQEVGAAVRSLCEPDADGHIHEDRILAELVSLGGPDSTLYGPLEDLDSAADSLDSAVDDVTSALGDGEEQQPQPPEAPSVDPLEPEHTRVGDVHVGCECDACKGGAT